MGRRLFTLMIALAALASSLVARSLDDWQRFVSLDKSFAVLLPGNPEHSTQTTEKSDAKAVTEIYRLKDHDVVYIVGVTEYSVDVDPKTELDLDRDNFLKALNAKFTRESDITLTGHQGRDFEGSTDAYDLVSRLVMEGSRRVYQVAVAVPKSGDHSVARKCIDSFEILTRKPQT